LLCVALAAIAACSTPAPNGIVTGTLNYSERITLAPGSTATVELIRQGGTPTTIATTTFAPSSQVPIAFTLTYDPTRIDVTLPYALRARIASPEGTMMFMTSTDTPIVFDGNPVALQLQYLGGGTGTVGTQRR
jgi:uncharacterized lipoprotein YbaY